MPQTRRRWPYRAVQEIEDAIAHLLSVLVMLEKDRRHAATPEEWHRLNTMGEHIEPAFDFLRDMRQEMREHPPEDEEEK